MLHTFSTRSVSLGASLLLTGAALFAALNARTVVELMTQPDPTPITSIDLARSTPPPPPTERTPRAPRGQAIVAISPLPPLASDEAPRFTEVLGAVSAPGPTITDPSWIERPRVSDYERFFPRRALDRGVSGAVMLDCLVDAIGRVSCAVVSEDPPNWGFGEASLRAAALFRMAPASRDGQPTGGGLVQIPMRWRAE